MASFHPYAQKVLCLNHLLHPLCPPSPLKGFDALCETFTNFRQFTRSENDNDDHQNNNQM